MDTDNGSSPVGDGIGKYLPWMHQAVVEQSDGDNTALYQFVCTVECDTDEVLLPLSDDAGYEREHVFGPCDLPSYRNGWIMTPGKFKGSKDLACLYRTDTRQGRDALIVKITGMF
jgi:hypothetical protein